VPHAHGFAHTDGLPDRDPQPHAPGDTVRDASAHDGPDASRDPELDATPAGHGDEGADTDGDLLAGTRDGLAQPLAGGQAEEG
jgi:hypothetical protein